MTDTLTTWLERLAGAVLARDLRVLSRRRSIYALRAGFLLLAVVIVWGAWFNFRTAAGGRAARPAQVPQAVSDLGREVVIKVVWLQFVTGHLLATMVMSEAFSGAVRRRSLETLLASPMSRWRVVISTLGSGLVPVGGMLLLTTPLLAVVRVWGGIPWDYVWTSVWVVFWASLWVAAASLFLSLWCRRPHTVVVTVLVMIVLAYALGQAVLNRAFDQGHINDWAFLWCPYAMQKLLDLEFQHPGGAHLPVGRYALVLAASAGLWLAGARLCLSKRTMALMAAVIHRPSWTHAFIGCWHQIRQRRDADCRPVTRALVFWRECRARPGRTMVVSLVAALVLSAVCAALAYQAAVTPMNQAWSRRYQWVVSGLWLVAILRSGTLAVWSMAREHEARTWALLLSSPLTAAAIFWQKAAAVAWKNLYLWTPLAAATGTYLTVMAFRMSGRGPNPDLLLRAGLSAGENLSLAALVIGIGLYWGIRMPSMRAGLSGTLGTVLVVLVIFQFWLYPWVHWRVRTGSPQEAMVHYRSAEIGMELLLALLAAVLGYRRLCRCRRGRHQHGDPNQGA